VPYQKGLTIQLDHKFGLKRILNKLHWLEYSSLMLSYKITSIVSLITRKDLIHPMLLVLLIPFVEEANDKKKC